LSNQQSKRRRPHLGKHVPYERGQCHDPPKTANLGDPPEKGQCTNTAIPSRTCRRHRPHGHSWTAVAHSHPRNFRTSPTCPRSCTRGRQSPGPNTKSPCESTTHPESRQPATYGG